MKSLALILLLTIVVAAFSCSDDDDPEMGCMTGIPKSGGTHRELIKCCTRDQYLAGSNVKAGGDARFSNYNTVQWTPADDCSECQ